MFLFPFLHFVKAVLLNIATDLNAVRIESIVGYENVVMIVACKQFFCDTILYRLLFLGSLSNFQDRKSSMKVTNS